MANEKTTFINSSFSDVLRHRYFMSLWGAQTLGKIAENILHFFFVLYLFEISKNSFLVSLLVVAYSIPPILFSSIAGVIADSFDRKRIFLIANFFRIVFLAIAYPLSHHPIGIMIGAVLLSSVNEFFGPSHNASIPSLVPQQHLFFANTMSTLTAYASFLIGFSAAGPLLYYFGRVPIFIIAAIMFSLALVLQLTLPALDHHLRELKHQRVRILKNAGLLLGRMLEGVRFIRHHPLLMLVLFQAAFSFTIERAFVSLLPSFSEQLLQFTARDISFFLIIPTGLGAILGALAANRFKNKIFKPYLIVSGLILNGLGLFCVALYPTLSPLFPPTFLIGGFTFLNLLYVMFLAVASGLADPLIIVTTQTLIQERTPAATRGRVFGGLITFMNLLGILPVIGIGWLASQFDISSVVVGLGIITLLVAFGGLLFYKKLSAISPTPFDSTDYIEAK